MHNDTKLATLGLAPEDYDGVINFPVTRASTIGFPNLEEFERSERGEHPGPTYGRYGNPTQIALENAIAELEGADHCIVFASGLSAIVSALTAFVGAGDHLLMPDTAYGPSRRFCDQFLARFGVEVTYYDPLVGSGIAQLMKPNTKLVYLESPGSQTFEVQDVPAIVAEAKKRGAITVLDNTWATPIGFRAIEKGVDIVMHSATKYISGHSDFVMGTLSCQKEHYKKLLHNSRNLGACPAADNCALALRGLRTMAVRLQRHRESALKVAAWLKARPEVSEVFFPALPGAPGHDIWKRDFTEAGGLFSFMLKPVAHEKLAAFINGLQLYTLGYSWGGFESLITTSNIAKVRTATQWKYEGTQIRLFIGLENPDDLIADLEAGFRRMA